MKIIELTQGERSLVSDEDFDAVMDFKWYYMCNRKSGYATRKVRIDGKRTAEQLHVFVAKRMGVWVPGCEIDHGRLSNCSLDNRRENLRAVTHRQNNINKGFQSSNTSGVPGISWHKGANKWQVQIKVGGHNKHIGHFDNLRDAAFTRWDAEKTYYGEFRYQPFRVCPLSYTPEGCECIRKVIQEEPMLNLWREYTEGEDCQSKRFEIGALQC
jgi:hypothetical protein